MPITIFEFEGISAGTEKGLRRVHAFLKEHRDFAYTEDELKAAVPVGREEVFREALDLLLYLGGIEERFIGGREYFAYQGNLPI